METALNTRQLQPVEVIDSHTGGEPTRVVIAGGPRLHGASMAERLSEFRHEHDAFRRAVITEPRGSDVLVGGLLGAPLAADAAASVIFFNNVGFLGMCGHGTVGLAVTLAHLGRLERGSHRLETPAGTVRMTLHDANRVSVENVASYRYRRDVSLPVAGIGTVRGDVAWGGNWFFLVANHGLELAPDNTEALTEHCRRIRRALDASDIRGENGALIDHVELSGPPSDRGIADGRNFVLCPGSAYDRSPCGTGTSARLACLVADGRLAPGDVWRQQGICGSVFEARGTRRAGGIVPTITGSAWITARVTLLFDANDPFRSGLPGGR